MTSPLEATVYLRSEMKKDPLIARMCMSMASRHGHSASMDGFLEWAGSADAVDELMVLEEAVREMEIDRVAMTTHDEAWVEARRS